MIKTIIKPKKSLNDGKRQQLFDIKITFLFLQSLSNVRLYRFRFAQCDFLF